ncbi:hypothetical protein CR205_14265 [Alteribacter lacisalsi]|uniref:DUF3221 domain-containing protein n=1 Tax=Alteribacter lacisalsi TaxID=2045244 RepID=A0A2W0H9V8_9BACI|nr:DUF3221 domain-containing protein [Alteribacter lacisalsi]PYZ96840.1 hypothetical protein CR205_14265 [Alteribacter lacisalsi]
MKTFLGVLCLFFLAACGTGGVSDSDPIEGRVVDRGGNSILIVSDISEEEAAQIDGENIAAGGAGAAYWFSGIEDPSQYAKGTLVRVWAGEIAESYPAQGEAERIEVVEE